MREKRREPEVPGEEVPVVECIDGLARITSKELASTHSVRVVANLGRSALMHIVRLMNNLVKGPKRMMTRVQWPC